MVRIPLIVRAFALVAMSAGTSIAQQAASHTPDLTRADVEAWLDGFLPFALTRGDVAGAAVVVVKNGQTVLAKGYGFADVARHIPVDAERTLFRGGSVGKLFTWTAVMQLVEQGKLDLDADINRYLDFAIPARDGKAITLRNLMTHTPGFEEIVKNLVTTDSARLLPLGQYLRARTPPRIFPPGAVPAYSNYGATLAGYIVQRVSGEPFDDYIERHIFSPLGMGASTFREPLPAHLRGRMSQGYRTASGPPQPYELFGPVPAGGQASTGADMARFMIAHLQNGTLGSAHILGAETAQQMHSSALPIVPPLDCMLLGFMRRDRNGRRIIGHEGDTQFFHSALSLFLDDGVGVYISMNSTGTDGAAGPIRTALIEQFTNRYFPATADTPPTDTKAASEHVRIMLGHYTASRSTPSTFLSLLDLPGQVVVTQTANGALMIDAFRALNGQPKQWKEIAPFLWREIGGTERLAAKVEGGRVTMFSVDGLSPFNVFLPVAWWRSSAWLMPSLIASLTILLLTVGAWPAMAVVRRHYDVPFPLSGNAAHAHQLIRVAGVAMLLTFIAWVATVVPVATNLAFYSSQLDPWVWTLHIASAVVFVSTVAIALWNAWLTWTARRTWYAKLWNASLAMACLTILWVAVAFKLIAFNANV